MGGSDDHKGKERGGVVVFFYPTSFSCSSAKTGKASIWEGRAEQVVLPLLHQMATVREVGEGRHDEGTGLAGERGGGGPACVLYVL